MQLGSLFLDWGGHRVESAQAAGCGTPFCQPYWVMTCSSHTRCVSSSSALYSLFQSSGPHSGPQGPDLSPLRKRTTRQRQGRVRRQAPESELTDPPPLHPGQQSIRGDVQGRWGRGVLTRRCVCRLPGKHPHALTLSPHRTQHSPPLQCPEWGQPTPLPLASSLGAQGKLLLLLPGGLSSSSSVQTP